MAGCDPPPPPPPPRALSFEARGLASLEAKEWGSAISQLSDALDGVPSRDSDKRCKLLLARARGRLGKRRDLLLAQPESCQEADSHSHDKSKVSTAALALALDSYEDAAHASELRPGSAEAFEIRSLCNEARLDFAAAAEDAAAAALLAADDATRTDLERAAAVAIASRDTAAAEDVASGGGPAATKARGDAHFQRGDLVGASAAYTLVLQHRAAPRGREADGDNPVFEKTLANRAAACDAAPRAIAIDSTRVAEHAAPPRASETCPDSRYLKLGRLHAALADGDAATSTNVRWARGHLRRAAALRGLQRPREATCALVHGLQVRSGRLHAIQDRSAAAKCRRREPFASLGRGRRRGRGSLRSSPRAAQ